MDLQIKREHRESKHCSCFANFMHDVKEYILTCYEEIYWAENTSNFQDTYIQEERTKYNTAQKDS